MLVLLAACTASSILVTPGDSGADPSPGPHPDAPIEQVPAETGHDEPDGDLFEPLRILELGLSVDAAAWSSLSRDGSRYADVILEHEGWSWPVQIHIKGSSTWQDISQKPSLVVDVNSRSPNAEFLGAKKFYLHNQAYDPSMMSEMLAYGLYREWGYPASRVNYARLTLNGQDYGLYAVVEAINDDFLETWFPDPDGNLYENAEAYCDVWDIGCMEVEENDEGGDEALRSLGDAARGGDFVGDVQPLLDFDRFVEYLAFEAGIVHWDSYSYDLSNYLLYHDPTAQRWTLLTQSMDLDFGWRPWSYPSCGMYAIDPGTYTMGALASQCQQDPTCHAAFVQGVADVADRLEKADGAARVRDLDAFIGDQVRSDPRRLYGDGYYAAHVACLQDFFDERPGLIRKWVEGER